MKNPKVREVIQNYQKGNLRQVMEYLNQSDMIVDPNTWEGKIKKMIEDEQFFAAKVLIENVAYKLKL